MVPIPDVPGVYLARSGLVLNEDQRNFLRVLRSKLDFNPVVTSGIRTPDEQARLMWDSYRKNGYDYMNRLYAADVSFLRTAKSVTDVKNMIVNALQRGIFFSDHMRGQAIDFRVNDLSSSQFNQLSRAIRDLGVELLDEKDHFHAEGVGSIKAQVRQAVEDTKQAVGQAIQSTQTLVRKAQSIPLSYYIVSGVLITVAGSGILYAILRKKKKNKKRR